MDGARDVQKRLVDRYAFDKRRIMAKNLEYLIRNLLIEVHVRSDEDGVRTAFVGRAGRHGRVDAELAGLVGAGRDNAAFVGAGADDDGLSAPFGMVQEFDGREEGVHVDMEDRCHGKRL